MFCKNCGKEVPDGTKFCPNCGAQVETEAPKTETYTGTVNGAAGGPKNRSIGVCILLSIVTCGIYGIIWLVQMVDELNAAAGETNATSGIMVFLLSLVTCNIYSWYWFYKAGELVNRASGAHGGTQDQNRGILYLILSIIGFNIISMALIQDELNKLA
ncbi:MAG: DUF4234 domain-containing protein [Clostridiales bacterium]|nr:DUF4234 domain-containing protein [Clostridiales bacterium]